MAARIRALTYTKENWKEELMRRNGVIGVGVGKDAILIYVEKGVTVTPPIPATLDGMPVKIIETGKFEFL